MAGWTYAGKTYKWKEPTAEPWQNELEMRGSTFTQNFFNKYTGKFLENCDNLKIVLRQDKPHCQEISKNLRKGMSWVHEIYVDTSLFLHRYKVLFNIKLIMC